MADKKLTPQEIANIKAHADFIKSNPDRFTKDPDPATHARRMKTDSEYRSDLARAKYVKQTMKQIGTQAGHSVTDSNNFSRPVGGESGIGLGSGLPEQMK